MQLPPGAAAVVEHLRVRAPGGLVGVWLHGSATGAGLRPDSDVDLLAVTARTLDTSERRGLVEVLLQHSGRRATVRPGRPLELVSYVRDDVVPWRHPPVRDLLYGEWLRDELTARAPERAPDPDAALLLTAARPTAVPLVGPGLADVVGPVPADDVRRAVLDCLDPVLGDLEGDERNVLLTLARMVVTTTTGRVVDKARAASTVAAELEAAGDAGEAPRLLRLAREGYLGTVADHWADEPVRDVAEALARRVRSSAG